MGRVCFGFIRSFIIMENLVLAAIASLLLYISFSAMDQDFGMDTLNDKHPKDVHNYIVAISIGVGIIIILLSLLGLFGAIKKSESALGMFAAIIFFMIIMLSFLVVFTFTMQNSAGAQHYKDVDKSFVNSTLQMYNYTESKDVLSLLTVTRILDYVQTNLNCCGINSPNDWKEYGTKHKLPKSCCSNHTEFNHQQPFNYCEQSDFKEGCWRAFTDRIRSNLDTLRMALYMLIGFGLVCSLAAFYMVRHLRRSLEVV